MGQSNGCTTTQCCTARSPCGPRQDEFADKVERGQKPDVYTTAGVLDKDASREPKPVVVEGVGINDDDWCCRRDGIQEKAWHHDQYMGPKSVGSSVFISDVANAEDHIEFQLFHPPLPPPMEASPGTPPQMQPATEAPSTNSGGASLIDEEAQRRRDSFAAEVNAKRTLRFNEDVEAKSLQLTSLLPLKGGRSDDEQEPNDREEGNPADDGQQVDESRPGMSSDASPQSGTKKMTAFWNPASPATEEENSPPREKSYPDLQVFAKLVEEEAPTQPEQKKKSMVRSFFNSMSKSKPAEEPMDNVPFARDSVPNGTNCSPVRSPTRARARVRGSESKPLPVS